MSQNSTENRTRRIGVAVKLAAIVAFLAGVVTVADFCIDCCGNSDCFSIYTVDSDGLPEVVIIACPDGNEFRSNENGVARIPVARDGSIATLWRPTETGRRFVGDVQLRQSAVFRVASPF